MPSARPAAAIRFSGRDVVRLAVFLSFPVTGLDQLLHTPLAWFSAQPLVQAQHWITGSLILLPVFAVGVWAGEWIADRAGLDPADRTAIFKRALVVVLCVTVVLVPIWYERNKSDGLASMQALITPHSRGGVDVYWVSSRVIVALVSICLVAGAIWMGLGVSGRMRSRWRRPGSVGLAKVLVLALLVCAALALAWLLQQVAQHAYASQVDYTRASLSVPDLPHSRLAGHGSVAGQPAAVRLPAVAAPFAVGYQLAHAVQDGLADQAAGLPVAAMALLLPTRQPGSRNQATKQPSNP